MYKYALKCFTFLRINKQLLLQFLLVIATFSIMVIISGNFAADIVSKHIASYGSEVVSVSARNVDSYLTGFCITLEYVSIFIEGLYSGGADTERIKREVEEWAEWIRIQNRFGTMINIYCYVNDTFIDGNKWAPARDYIVPQQQQWYTGAYKNYGEIFFSEQDIDYRTGRRIISVSKVMFDDNNETFGVVAIDVFLSEIANHVRNMSFLGGGFGVLLDSDRRYLILPEEEFIGVKLESVNEGKGDHMEVAALLAAGEELIAYKYTRHNGDTGILFMKQLFNGWYIGFVSPYHIYYNEVYLMRFILICAGLISVILICSVLTYMHIRVKRSDETNRMKSSFLAKMSHEMRTPINAILGMSEYLQHEQLNMKQMDFINDINYSASSFLSLIDDLLDMSKIEVKEITPSPVHITAEKETEKPRDKYTISAPSARVLVVDDNELNLKTITALLNLVNIIPKTVITGREAIELIKKENYDIIFMDQMMPEMDGIETTQHIRAWERENISRKKADRIPIIAFTANTVEGAREMFLASGFDEYMPKPVKLSELKKCLIEWLPEEKVKIIEKPSALKNLEENLFDTDLQKKLQLSFLKTNRNFYGEIVTALQENDIALAYRLSHTLKSSAALLGKTALQNIAASIEYRLKDGENLVTEEQLGILENELNIVLNEFTPLLDEAQTKTQTQSQPLDIESARELINKLEPFIEMGSPESMKLIDSLRRIPQAEKLIEQIEDFDFQDALVTLMKLKEKLESDFYNSN
jgi:CheY-like chemotaxis protein